MKETEKEMLLIKSAREVMQDNSFNFYDLKKALAITETYFSYRLKAIVPSKREIVQDPNINRSKFINKDCERCFYNGELYLINKLLKAE